MEGLTFLDIGCGYGATGLYIRTRTYKNGWTKIIGLDPFKEYLDLQSRMGIYDQLIHGKGEDVLNYLGKDSVDYSISQHSIEHMRKEKTKSETTSPAFKFLKVLEMVTKTRIIICTPNGYTESGPLDGNEDNNHLSGWEAEDFIKLGYKTKIVTKNVNSRLLTLFAKTVFKLKGKRWDNEVLVAWKDL